jgi:hypothetical protein
MPVSLRSRQAAVGERSRRRAIRRRTFRTSPPALLSALFAGAIASIALATAIIGRPSAPGAALAGQFTYVGAPRRLDADTIHHFSYDSPGGPTTIRWYDSDWEPTVALSYAVASIYIDGRPVASTVKTARLDTYEDGAGYLVWHGTLPAGEHSLSVVLAVSPHWGAPYTDPGKIGGDGLIIQSSGSNAG